MKLNTNKEKLNDAVGMLDEDTVQTAMIRAADLKEIRVERRATLRRRAVVLLAACLSLTLMIGALLAIPMMTPHDPPVTSGRGCSPRLRRDANGETDEPVGYRGRHGLRSGYADSRIQYTGGFGGVSVSVYHSDHRLQAR